MKIKFNTAISFMCMFLPNSIKIPIYRTLLKYEIGKDCHIGMVYLSVKKVEIKNKCSIGHLTVIKGLDELIMEEHSSIGRLNWVSGFPSDGVGFFESETERCPRLSVGMHAAITNRHIIDCTNSIDIGCYSTIAGFNSQLLTHSINLKLSRQESIPIKIGSYCFIGTATTILPGCDIPNNCIVGANSLINKRLSEENKLYAGCPAKSCDKNILDYRYFYREKGEVN